MAIVLLDFSITYFSTPTYWELKFLNSFSTSKEIYYIKAPEQASGAKRNLDMCFSDKESVSRRPTAT